MGSSTSQPTRSDSFPRPLSSCTITSNKCSISVFFWNPVPATCKYIPCRVLTGSLLFPSKLHGGGEKKKSTAFYITKWLISLTASHPAATREARLNWFSNQPQGAREHWSSASGEHRLGFRATFGLLKLHTRSQVFGSRSPVTFHKSLCLPPTADRVSMLFTEVKNGETTYDWDGGHNAESIHLL